MAGHLLSCNLMVALEAPMVACRATTQLQEPHMPVIERDVVLPVPRERAWELITEPAELEEWLGEDVDFEAQEGAPLHVTFEDGGEREGVVEQVDVEERVVFRWGDSRVEWRLDDAPGGTRFTVVEHRFGDDSLVWGPRLQAAAAASMLCPV
jgi:uncharacterized protein YndB with AHSA1/START domain